MSEFAPAPAPTSSAFMRNRDPIREVLRQLLPAHGTVLEIASGSGDHAAYFAAAFPSIRWQPTDRDPGAIANIAACRERAGIANLLPPLALDAGSADWPVTRADAVVSINMIHISPWSSAEGLFASAARILPPGGILFLYGPFKEGGRHTADSNAAFDESLRARNAEWGVRDLDDVYALAARHAFALSARFAMPANNLSLVFARKAA